MRKFFRLITVTVIGLVAVSALSLNVTLLRAAQLATETLQPTATFGGPTVFVADQVNVRSGPDVKYEQVGVLIAGQTAPAIGRSPASEWVQIEYPGGPGGVAWVYAPLVTIRAGTLAELPVAEIPPTATIPPTPTALPGTGQPGTVAPTRLPTFTAGPPIVQPTFQTPELGGGSFPPAVLIIGLFIIGVFAGMMVVLRQRG